MATKVSVAEAKKNFSELMGRAHYKGERFVIERRGKPMVAIIPVEELERLEEQANSSQESEEAISDEELTREIDEMVARIYEDRQRDFGREINLDE